jgi:hypothetical protein
MLILDAPPFSELQIEGQYVGAWISILGVSNFSGFFVFDQICPNFGNYWAQNMAKGPKTEFSENAWTSRTKPFIFSFDLRREFSIFRLQSAQRNAAIF